MITNSRAMSDWLRTGKLTEILQRAVDTPTDIRVWIGETISDVHPPAVYHYYFEEPRSFQSYVGGGVVPRITLWKGSGNEDQEKVVEYLVSLGLSTGQADYIVTALMGGSLPDSGNDNEEED